MMSTGSKVWKLPAPMTFLLMLFGLGGSWYIFKEEFGWLLGAPSELFGASMVEVFQLYLLVFICWTPLEMLRAYYTALLLVEELGPEYFLDPPPISKVAGRVVPVN
jgi:hypothetical protein